MESHRRNFAHSALPPRVFIVEDEAIVAENLSHTVTALGYQVVGVFDTGEEAIHVLRETSADLVLLDLQLAGHLDGVQTAEKIRHVSDAAILFLTAHSDPETVKRANASDPYGYILKPFGDRDLAVQLTIALHKHRADRARRETQEAQAKYLRLIDSGFDAIVVRDAQDRITSWNHGAEEIYGWSRTEALGRITHSLLQTRFPKPIEQILVDVLENERWEGELIHTRKDGTPITVLSRWTLERDAQGQRASILEINSDITDRKQSEQKLRKSEELLLAAQRGAKAGVWEIDLRTARITWSEPYYDLFGLDRSIQPSLAVWLSSIHPEDRPRIAAEHQQSIKEHRDQDMEFRIVKPDRTIRWIHRKGQVEFDEQGEAIRINGISFDITDRKQAEEAVTAAALFPAQNPSPVLRVNAAGVLLYMNPASNILLGELHLQAGQPVPEYLAGLVHQSLQTGRSQQVENNIGSCHYLISITPIVKEHYANLYWTDITERKQTEEGLRMRSKQLQLLYELANAVNRADALPSLYETAMETIVFALGANRGSILTLDDHGMMRFQAWRGLSESYRAAVQGHSPWKPGQVDYAPILVPDVRTSDIEPALRTTILQEGIAALAFIPLTYRGRLIGKFMVYFDEARAMTNEEMEMARSIANTLAIAIERKQVEDALRASEERLRTAMAAGHMGAWDIDLLTGAVTWDARQYEIFGLSVSQRPRNMDEFYKVVHPDDVDRVKRAAAATELTGQFCEEFRIIRPDGTVRWIMGQGAIISDGEGRPIHMVGVNDDITEKKDAQSRFEHFAIELERQVTSRTAELSESQERLRLLTTELNLTEQRERKRLAVSLHDDLAQMLVLCRLKLSQARRVSADKGLNFVSQTDQILDEALAYTRTLVADLAPPVLFDLGLPAALKWLATWMNRYEMDVVFSMPDDMSVKLQEQQAVLLFQSVRELLMNSYKHGRSGEAFVTLRQEGNVLQIDVVDHGIGFDANSATMPTKFGLFNIRERMNALGGSFVIESSPGHGTQATLVLPLRDTLSPVSETLEEVPSSAHSPTQHEETGRLVPHTRGSIRVLLVDDHAMVRQGLRSVLEGYDDVEIVGEAALEINNLRDVRSASERAESKEDYQDSSQATHRWSHVRFL